MNYFAQHGIGDVINKGEQLIVAALCLKVVMKQTNLDHGGDRYLHASSTSLSAVLCVDRCQEGPG